MSSTVATSDEMSDPDEKTPSHTDSAQFRNVCKSVGHSSIPQNPHLFLLPLFRLIPNTEWNQSERVSERVQTGFKLSPGRLVRCESNEKWRTPGDLCSPKLNSTSLCSGSNYVLRYKACQFSRLRFCNERHKRVDLKKNHEKTDEMIRILLTLWMRTGRPFYCP